MKLAQPHFWEQDAINKPFGWSLLWLASLLYVGGVHLRRAFTKTVPLPGKSVCVGNLVAGGAGKTPVLIALAHLFGTDRIVFITRGYGGSIDSATLLNDAHDVFDAGDEALLLRRIAPVIVGPDRVASAKLAGELFPGHILLLDDGLQNPTFRATINLLVWDLFGAGNGHCLPAGPLREPRDGAMNRVDAVIALNGAQPPKTPAFSGTGHVHNPDHKGAVIAFAGIGRPAKFRESLERAGYVIAGFHPFPDHHHFTPEELQPLFGTGLPLLTTEKDWVRLAPEWQDKVAPVPYDVHFGHPQNLLHWLQDHLK